MWSDRPFPVAWLVTLLMVTAPISGCIFDLFGRDDPEPADAGVVVADGQVASDGALAKDGASGVSITRTMPSGVRVSITLTPEQAALLPFPLSQLTAKVLAPGAAPEPDKADVKNIGGGLLRLGPAGTFKGWIPLQVVIPAGVLALGEVPGLSHYDPTEREWVPQVASMVTGAKGETTMVVWLNHFSDFAVQSITPEVASVNTPSPSLVKSRSCMGAPTPPWVSQTSRSPSRSWSTKAALEGKSACPARRSAWLGGTSEKVQSPLLSSSSLVSSTRKVSPPSGVMSQRASSAGSRRVSTPV